MAKASGAKIEKQCPICETAFAVYKSHAHNYTTCGVKKCQSIHRSGKRNGRYRVVVGHRTLNSGRVLCKCKHCKRYFSVLPHKIREYKNQRSFCSRECCQMYASHKQGKECIASCFCLSPRQRVASCEVCGCLVARHISVLIRRNRRVFCSPTCSFVDKQRRILITCALCGKEVCKEGHRMTAKTEKYFCGVFCWDFFKAQEHREQTVYTPEFIRSLIVHVGNDCSFPNCGEERIVSTRMMNPWGLCALHASRVYRALSEKRRTRERILSAHNL